jgi:predicted small lipoprotein YifL
MSRLLKIAAIGMCLIPFSLTGCGGGSEPVVLPPPNVSDAEILQYHEDGEKSRLEESKYD